MKILIMGSGGVGGYYGSVLFKNGHDVKAFVLYNFGNSNGWLDRLDVNTRKKLKICKGDVREEKAIKFAEDPELTVIKLFTPIYLAKLF